EAVVGRAYDGLPSTGSGDQEIWVMAEDPALGGNRIKHQLRMPNRTHLDPSDLTQTELLLRPPASSSAWSSLSASRSGSYGSKSGRFQYESKTVRNFAI